MKKETLTERQKQILELIAQGFNDYEISQKLECTVANIRSLSDRIIYKVKAENRPNLIYKAMQKGLIK